MGTTGTGTTGTGTATRGTQPNPSLKNGFHIDLGYHPFVSVHVAAYNEKRVIERLLTALSQLEYPAYEVILVDDSTDDSNLILSNGGKTGQGSRSSIATAGRVSRAGR